MKKLLAIMVVMLFFVGSLFTACQSQEDYKTTEYYKQEVYLISSESTSATDREVYNIEVHTFVDTFKMLNEAYDYEKLFDTKSVKTEVIFKVGMGGSLPAQRDVQIILVKDEEAISDYNTLHNTTCAFPDASEYTCNWPYDEAKGGFVVDIAKGSSSTSIKFTIDIERNLEGEKAAEEDETAENPYKKYSDMAFAIKVKDAGELPISRLYDSFMACDFAVNSTSVINWNGLPVGIPWGRYRSTQLIGNAAENTDADGYRHIYKFVLPMDDPTLPREEKLYPDQYMIFGTSAWSWEFWGYHPWGFMWNKLELNDAKLGTYSCKPIIQGDINFPACTFGGTVGMSQIQTDDCSYDPITKTLLVHYANVLGSAEYWDLMTFVDQDITLKVSTNTAVEIPRSWANLKSKNYKYWIPEDADK